MDVTSIKALVFSIPATKIHLTSVINLFHKDPSVLFSQAKRILIEKLNSRHILYRISVVSSEMNWELTMLTRTIIDQNIDCFRHQRQRFIPHPPNWHPIYETHDNLDTLIELPIDSIHTWPVYQLLVETFITVHPTIFITKIERFLCVEGRGWKPTPFQPLDQPSLFNQSNDVHINLENLKILKL